MEKEKQPSIVYVICDKLSEPLYFSVTVLESGLSPTNYTNWPKNISLATLYSSEKEAYEAYVKHQIQALNPVILEYDVVNKEVIIGIPIKSPSTQEKTIEYCNPKRDIKDMWMSILKANEIIQLPDEQIEVLRQDLQAEAVLNLLVGILKEDALTDFSIDARNATITYIPFQSTSPEQEHLHENDQYEWTYQLKLTFKRDFLSHADKKTLKTQSYRKK